MIIGISGKRGSGKDTLADILQHRGFEKLSLATLLKDRVAADFHVPVSLLKDPATKELPHKAFGGLSPREVMISYGQFFRSIDPNFWIKALDIPGWHKIHSYVSVADVRFKNEAAYIKRLGGIIVRLERDPALNVYGPEALNDPSETDLDNYEFDYKLTADQNRVMSDLHLFADMVIKSHFKAT